MLKCFCDFTMSSFEKRSIVLSICKFFKYFFFVFVKSLFPTWKTPILSALRDLVDLSRVFYFYGSVATAVTKQHLKEKLARELEHVWHIVSKQRVNSFKSCVVLSVNTRHCSTWQICGWKLTSIKSKESQWVVVLFLRNHHTSLIEVQ